MAQSVAVRRLFLVANSTLSEIRRSVKGKVTLNFRSFAEFSVASNLGEGAGFVKKKLQKRLRKLKSIAAASESSALPFPDEVGVKPLERIREEHLSKLGYGTEFPVNEKENTNAEEKSRETGFEDLGLSVELINAVSDLELTKPTEIQSIGIPLVLMGKDVVLASHTGSGKTLAYLLPVVQLLREWEINSGVLTKPRKPRAIVLCPTRELAEQVLQVAKSLCHHARFRSAMISGGGPMKGQQEALSRTLDLIVGTPGRIVQHQTEGNLSLSDVKYVVLDEADTMFDRGFGPEVGRLLAPMRKRCADKGDSFQTVMVTATISRAIRRLLDEEFPGIQHVQTATLHKKVASAKHEFLQVKGDENKMETLQQILNSSLRKFNRVMVFCNTVKSCRAVDHILSGNGTDTVNYHGEVPADQRVSNLERFRGSNPGSSFDSESGLVKEVSPVLVCTDLAARGLDLTVDHVIMFDFPNNPVDYLHRTGRTARMGAKGKITSLVTKHDYFLANQIDTAIARGESLEALTKDRSKVERQKQREVEERRFMEEKQARRGGGGSSRGRGGGSGSRGARGGGSYGASSRGGEEGASTRGGGSKGASVRGGSRGASVRGGSREGGFRGGASRGGGSRGGASRGGGSREGGSRGGSSRGGSSRGEGSRGRGSSRGDSATSRGSSNRTRASR